jgi:tight adherence protein B
MIELVAVAAVLGGAACWAVLAAPEIPAARAALSRLLHRALKIERVEVDLAQAELRSISPHQWIALRWGIAALAGAAAYVVFGLVVVAMVAALAAYHLVGLGLESRRRQAEAKRQRALLDAIRFGVSVMSRAGGALQMLRSLAESGPTAAQAIFRDLLAIAGSEESDALLDAVRRMRSRLADPLFDDIALALALHWTRGGRLVPALEAVAEDWTDSLRLLREAKALRAGIEASVLLLTILPFVFLFLLRMLAPVLLDPLGKPVGEVAFALAVGWMVIGHRVLQRMSEAPRVERITLDEDAL